jgi:asparagine synthase (glutamine-hydrolysing)
LKDTDQFSMASALEVREPFFDFELVEYVLAVPDNIKYPTYPKSLLVEALKPMLPDEIVHRPKMGFVLPWEKWMRDELWDFCEVRIKRLSRSELLDESALGTLWNSFLTGKNGVMWSQLWHLVVLADWLEANEF